MTSSSFDNRGDKVIELYYKTGSIKYFLFWLTIGMLLFAIPFGVFVPAMFFTDEATKGQTDLYGYVIFIAVCVWIIAFIIFLYMRHFFYTLKRAKIPIVLDSKGVRNLPSSRKAAELVDMQWEDITKIARSASIPGSRRSFNKDRLGTLTAFYSAHDGKPVRCIIDWSLLGIKGMKEQYKNIHYFIADNAVESCTLESYPDAWPTP